MDELPRPIEASSYRCIGCGFDLTGSAIGGSCPECGRPVKESLRVSTGRHNGTNSSYATVSLVLGIVGLVTSCVILSPFAIWLYYKAREDVARGVASPDSMGMATAGLVLGWIGTVLMIGGCCFGFLMIWLAAV